MSELLRNPDALAKATEELDRVIGRERLVTEGDIPNLPYTEAIVKETMRLHPVTPLLSPRISREDASVDSYAFQPARSCSSTSGPSAATVPCGGTMPTSSGRRGSSGAAWT